MKHVIFVYVKEVCETEANGAAVLSTPSLSASIVSQQVPDHQRSIPSLLQVSRLSDLSHCVTSRSVFA